MKLIINFILFFILIFAGMDMASAAEELTFERMLFVNDWEGVLGTTSSIDKIINDAAYINADVIMVQMTSEYFESARDPAKRSWDYRAGDIYSGMPMLEYFIQQSHAKGIQVHAWPSINIVNNVKDAEYRLFGPSTGYLYNSVSPTGKKYTTIPYRQDISFSGLQDYEIGLLTWVAKNYPTLDGLHIEEPLLFEYSYSPPVRQKVQAKFGYDILNPGSRTVTHVQQDITSVQRDSWNEFFTRLRSSINANKANPNFQVSANHWSVMYDSSKPYGLDPQYLADNQLVDFFVLQIGGNDLNIFRYKVKYATNAITSIPIIPIAFMYYKENTNIDNPPNPAFFDEVRYACDYGADGVGMFAWHWLEKYDGYIDGQNIMDTLHNMPPSSCGVSPEPPAPVLSSIMNPGFESGTTLWFFYTSGTGIFSTPFPGYEGSNTAQLALSSVSSNIQLYQKGIKLVPDTRYRLSFAAYSNTGHDMTVRLLKHVSPYTNYGLDFTTDLGTSWQTFTTEFTTSGFTSTVNDGRLKFWLAPFAASGDNTYD